MWAVLDRPLLLAMTINASITLAVAVLTWRCLVPTAWMTLLVDAPLRWAATVVVICDCCG